MEGTETAAESREFAQTVNTAATFNALLEQQSKKKDPKTDGTVTSVAICYMDVMDSGLTVVGLTLHAVYFTSTQLIYKELDFYHE